MKIPMIDDGPDVVETVCPGLRCGGQQPNWSRRTWGKVKTETPGQMKRSDPQEIYQKLRKKQGLKPDRCALYQFQGAVLDVPW